MSMVNDIDWKKEWWELYIECRESRELVRWNSRKDIGHSWVPGRKKSGMGNLLTLEKENGIQKSTKWYSDSKKLVTLCSKSFSALSRGILNSFFKSAHYLRSSGELGSTIWPDRGREGTSQFVCGQKDIDKCTTWRSTTLGISSDKDIWKQFSRNILSFEALSSRIQLSQLCEKARFQHRVSDGMKCETRPDEDDGWSIVPLCREKTRNLELVLNHESLQQFLGEQSLDQLSKFESWNFLSWRFQFHQLSVLERHLTLWSPEKQSVLRMKSMTTTKSSDPVANCSKPFRNQKGKNLVWKKEDPIALRNTYVPKDNKETCANPLSNFS